MDLDDQTKVIRLTEQYGKENLVVLLGSPDPDSTQIMGETVTVGDPTFAGPLAGVQLGLPVFHILEDEIKGQIPETTYTEQVGLMEMVLDRDSLVEAARALRNQ